jgi:hypothetical protein
MPLEAPVAVAHHPNCLTHGWNPINRPTIYFALIASPTFGFPLKCFRRPTFQQDDNLRRGLGSGRPTFSQCCWAAFMPQGGFGMLVSYPFAATLRKWQRLTRKIF